MTRDSDLSPFHLPTCISQILHHPKHNIVSRAFVQIKNAQVEEMALSSPCQRQVDDAWSQASNLVDAAVADGEFSSASESGKGSVKGAAVLRSCSERFSPMHSHGFCCEIWSDAWIDNCTGDAVVVDH